MMFNWDSGHDHMNGAWGWLGAGMMVLWMILLVAATGALIVWLLRSNRPGTRAEQSPREIIDVRYAKGEIDADQREQMHRNLASAS